MTPAAGESSVGVIPIHCYDGTVHVGIATRVNGQPPPDIALSDINLGTFEFWELDDDVRDAATGPRDLPPPAATGRSAAPARFSEAHRLDQIHRHAEARPETQDRADVAGNLGLVEGDVHDREREVERRAG